MRYFPATFCALAFALASAHAVQPNSSSAIPAGSRQLAYLPVIGWGMGQETTFAGSLSAALSVTKHPYDYTDLMGMSALAFRTRWYQGPKGERWSGMSPIGEGNEEIAALRKATGWELRLPKLSDSGEQQRKLVLPLLTAAIDSGQPIVTYDEKMDLGLIYGYEDEGQTFLTYDYYQKGTPVKLFASKLDPYFILIPGRYSAPLSHRDAFLTALKSAVKNWNRGAVMVRSDRKLWYGDSAYARWIDDLGNLDGLNESDRNLLFHASWWNMDSLNDSRRRASEYLRRNASLMKPAAGKRLEKASTLYDQEVHETGVTFMNKDVFLGPWTGKSMSDWTPEVRKNEIGLLKTVRDLDAQAVHEIEAALRTEASP